VSIRLGPLFCKTIGFVSNLAVLSHFVTLGHAMRNDIFVKRGCVLFGKLS